MPGFNLSIGEYKFPRFDSTRDLLVGNISGNNFSIDRYSLNKFQNDKLFFENDIYIVVLEGVVLNNHAFIKAGETWQETVIRIYETTGDVFFANFKGSFSGLLFDKRKNKWLIFTDHIGSKHIYFTKKGMNYLFSSEIKYLYDSLKENKISYSLDEQAAYMLLSYGYMLGDSTLCSEIKKLLPGHYLKIEDNKLSLHQYFALPDNYDESITEDEAIENIDRLFREAIRLQFEKDREYGYKHLVALSGGLDSRMTSWVAHEMGYTNQLNFTFSQSDYLDETIAKQIASDLKHEWIFKSLDNGLFLSDIDEINKISGGNALYYGLAHGNSMLRYLNYDNLGLIHSGQLGDVIIGSFVSNYKGYNNDKGSGAYSKKYIYKLKIDDSKLNNSDFEKMMFYRRCFNGANTGLLTSQFYSETMSPFYDFNFLNYCLSLDAKHRINHRLYIKWIKQKYPNSANYKWEKTKLKPGQKRIEVAYKGKKFPIDKIISLVLQKAGLKPPASSTKKHMNPLEYWYKTNGDIKQFQDEYFGNNINLIQGKQLKNDCMMLYNTGNAIEKNQVLTLLSAVKLFF